MSELNKSVKERHTRRACVDNMKCGEAGRSRVWSRSGKSSEIIVVECIEDVFVASDMLAGIEERGVNGGMKKWVGHWPKREEHLRNDCREEIGLPMTDTGHRAWL